MGGFAGDEHRIDVGGGGFAERAVSAESGYRRGAEFGDDHEDAAADAVDHLAVVVAAAALGAGLRWCLPG